ncbi:7597_t:CDS:2, partial [Gigaspora margarita]
VVGIIVARDGHHRCHYADVKVALWCLDTFVVFIASLFHYVTKVFVGRSLVLSFMALCESHCLVVLHQQIVRVS